MTALLRRLIVGIIRFLVGARSDWTGCLPQTRPRIYFANHSSHFDTLAIMAALPWPIRRLTRPVAARDYWGRTRFHRFLALRCLRAILIERHPLPDSDVLGPLAEALERGQSLVFFPEGTRSTGEEIAPFRSGLYHLALRCPEAELVPVYLDNLARIMPKGSPLIVPITCTARFGEPVAIARDEDKATFLIRARGAVLSLSQPRGGG